jgi:hypothetical protein
MKPYWSKQRMHPSLRWMPVWMVKLGLCFLYPIAIPFSIFQDESVGETWRQITKTIKAVREYEQANRQEVEGE